MKKLTGRSVIGSKRKVSTTDKENDEVVNSASIRSPSPVICVGSNPAQHHFTPILGSSSISSFTSSNNGRSPSSTVRIGNNSAKFIFRPLLGSSSISSLAIENNENELVENREDSIQPDATNPSQFTINTPFSVLTNGLPTSPFTSFQDENIRSTGIPKTNSTRTPLSDITANCCNSKRRKENNCSSENLITGLDLMGDFEQVIENNNGYSSVHRVDYSDFGDPTYSCQHCGATFWFEERTKKHIVHPSGQLEYSGCCNQGSVKLPLPSTPPAPLYQLFFGDSPKSRHFLQNIRSYNNMFCFTSMGGNIDRSVNTGGGPPVFKISGQNFHMIGSLIPQQGVMPKFAQLYIYDTQNEIQNRMKSVRKDGNIEDLHEDIVSDIKNVLDQNNILVKSFRMAKDAIELYPQNEIGLKLIGKRSKDARTYNMPTVSEIAALIVGDMDPTMAERDIIVTKTNGQLQRINQLNPSYLPLQYPLLFPYGEDGYREDILFSGRKADNPRGRKHISPREFLAFYVHHRVNHTSTLLFARRLLQQFLVDGYTMVEAARLIYIRTHQKALRCEAYKGLSDALTRGDLDPGTQGKRVILPSSFTGGARYMIQNYQDAMAICRWVGYPKLFITLTCNPKWPEIERFLEKSGLKVEDRPDIICRIFNMKLDAMLKDVRNSKIFGNVVAVVYTIEFQKRGLPHAHILLFLERKNTPDMASDIDKFISAEIPCKDLDPEYFNNVQDLMIHGPCGVVRNNSPCMVDGQCSKHFPKRFVDHTTLDKDGYPVYRRRDDGRSINKNGVRLDNRYVVPHNRYLLLKYKAHINVEWCNQSRSIKYLFKYVNKGHDRVTTEFYKNIEGQTGERIVDEINMYYDCRYVSPCEATWRLFKYHIHYRYPAVERLSFHLEDQQMIYFGDEHAVDAVLSRPTVGQSMFLAWFEANKIYPDARGLIYVEMPNKFVWKKDLRQWHPRKKQFSIGRMFYVPPGTGEIYYLRCLLNLVRGPTCYKDIRTVDGIVYDTFRDACYARGLLDDDNEYIDAINEASLWASGYEMRKLFVTALTGGMICRPEVVWNGVWHHLAEDATYNRCHGLYNQDITLTEEEMKEFALVEIEKMLSFWSKSLRDFPNMPIPDFDRLGSIENMLVREELAYDRKVLEEEHSFLRSQLTDEQETVYETIMNDLNNNNGGLFFLCGYGGTGKTFVWKTLSSAVRSRGEIVLNVASSGIASLLLPGGRTAHSRFAIPISLNEDSTCNIAQGSHLAELIIKCKLIIWDEAPMLHKHCFEALDRTMRDLLRFANPNSANQTFGGKTVVLGGDFRQILPVIPKGTRPDIVGASINASYLWNSCKVLKLTRNMRLQTITNNDDFQQIEWFSKWIASIGDGVIGGPGDGISEIDIPPQFLLESNGDPIATIVENIFPMHGRGYVDPSFFEGRAILSPTLDMVNRVNEYMCEMNHSEGRTYFSADTMCKSDMGVETLDDIHTPEFLNGIKCSGIPNHALTLKIGSPVMLLRNIDHSRGLCNGTRMIITRLGERVLEAKIIGGQQSGANVLLTRMSLTPSDPRIPFKFSRKQFPLMLSYAMTINKSQGQTLSHVGLLLTKPVFNHGQMYVALSRVNNPNGLKVLICDESGRACNKTTNVVYKEVFNNL